MKSVDAIIIGASAAGLMCAIEAGKRGRRVLVLDHSNKVGKKILMSGGGRCNFTNRHATPDCYISHNSHFCKSALSRYTPENFIDLVRRHQIPFHEKHLGQLFCDNKSKDIVDMLLKEATAANVTIQLEQEISSIDKADQDFIIKTKAGKTYTVGSLVIATGGLSIPTLGASAFGYKIAEQFGLNVWPTRAGLVPLTLHVADKETLAPLSGISVACIVQSEQMSFTEDLLFTHRGLSGPAILQISSYWHPGENLTINWLPYTNLPELLRAAQLSQPNVSVKNFLAQHLPKRMVETIINETINNLSLQSLQHKAFDTLINTLTQWSIKPNATEGYRTAEVTLGGVDCNALSSKTMEANALPGLYFVGEVVDVAGWLGGYNFQWAWASGWAAGQVV